MYAKLASTEALPTMLKHGNPDTVCDTNEGRLPRGWSVEVVTTRDQMLALESEWRSLEKRCDDANVIFQSFDWCLSWVSTYCRETDSSTEAQIYLLRINGALVAILPLMLNKSRFLSILTVLGEPHSQIANVIWDARSLDHRALSRLVDHVRHHSSADVVAFDPIPQGSGLEAALVNHNLREDPAAYISQLNWEQVESSSAYVSQISRNRRKDLLKKKRRLERMGKIEWKIVKPGDDDFSYLVELAVDWKRAWLKLNSLVSVGLSNEKLVTFLSGLSQSPAQDGHPFYVELEALFIDDKPIAISMSLIGCDVRHCYLSAYDLNYANASLGTLIHQFAIQHSIDTGHTGYSFLGHPTHFKSMWCNTSIPLKRLIIGKSAIGKVWVHVWALRIRPFLKSVLSTLKITFLSDIANSLIARFR